MKVEYSEGLPGERAKAAEEKPLVLGKHEEVIRVRRLWQEEGAKAEDRDGLPRLNHPCLQLGYSKPYRRLIYEGEPAPPRVQLVGK